MPELQSLDAYERVHAAGPLFVAAVRVEIAGAALRAKPRRADFRLGYARLGQLAAVGFHQVDMARAGFAKLSRHLRADFVAALSDAWADGGVYLRGTVCTAATARCSSSTSRMGMQSAVLTATRCPGMLSSSASPSPNRPVLPRAGTQISEWI